MIDCEHYKNYKGPNLKLAKIWKTKDEKLDITEYIREFYGHKNDWNGKVGRSDQYFNPPLATPINQNL